MGNDLIIVKAKISFKTTEGGGRATAILSGYRPNHVFNEPDHPKKLQTFIGDIQFEDEKYMYPGETKIVTVRFLKNILLENLIEVGKKWYINEGLLTIAEGEIMEILSP